MKHAEGRLAFPLLVVIVCLLSGCGSSLIRDLYYEPPKGTVRLTTGPETPAAVIRQFDDARTGERSDNTGLMLVPLVPFGTVEDPVFFKQPGDNYEMLSKQFQEMVRRHFASNGLFRMIRDDPNASGHSEALFEIRGVIHNAEARFRQSLFGLSFLGYFMTLGLLSHWDLCFSVEVSLECRDALGNVIASMSASGQTAKAAGNLWTVPNGGGAFERLDLLGEFLRPRVEVFAQNIATELNGKNAEYWERLTAERDRRVAEADVKRQPEDEKLAATAADGLLSKGGPTSAHSGPKIRVAVIDLKPNDVTQGLASTASEILRSTLFETGAFDVMDPQDMAAVLDLKEINTACDDTACWVDMGVKLKVEKMITGSIGKLGSTFVLTVKMIDVENAKVDKMVTEYCESEGEIPATIKRLCGR